MSGAIDPLATEIIGQLAQECDRVQNTDSHVYLIGATNKPDQVDGEVLDCFVEQTTVALPDKEQRRKLLAQLLSDKKLAFALKDGVHFPVEVSEGRGFGSRELENWVQLAEQNALMRAAKDGGPERYSIALEDFDSTQVL
jgi:SpoVK/Ycf46/Vps4 family AAA+-type ATPase